ncbi:hypothetical protein BVRB_000020 [Beta vulgaris subsp. vulgaris]|uniref:Uncharacterized protein n=1 Tax=Beta vulgaris subsp. vulgaris TaxID=3555 RepID=A0A0J8B8I6_BETVV|nr:hypothetical protein BVRB_000020 [Beta vulgaris subsp. vulgaris]
MSGVIPRGSFRCLSQRHASLGSQQLYLVLVPFPAVAKEQFYTTFHIVSHLNPS